ncbi:MAG: hypothetical protein AUJ07_11500 [Crenarchaeota archaeon 13_1_40CM_3_53_5]|nr:MAG: hypothetical protein AUJ07_11500 [Crenarchaeota archaeon 13_1_40CM_3_53_5]
MKDLQGWREELANSSYPLDRNANCLRRSSQRLSQSSFTPPKIVLLRIDLNPVRLLIEKETQLHFLPKYLVLGTDFE